MFKKLLLSFSLVCLLPFNTEVGTGHNVIYYIPHQDDETLTFGSSIYSHIQAGHKVHVVLLTDGSGTVVGKRLGLDKETLVDARNREFYKALGVLGVRDANIHLMNFTDGELTIKQAKDTMKFFERKYPNASHKTYTYTDWHSDHRNAGLALKELSDEGIIGDARYYVRRGEKPEGKHLMRSNYKEEHFPFLLAASRSYNIKNEKIGMYGIGWESVPNSFKNMEKNPVNYYHR